MLDIRPVLMVLGLLLMPLGSAMLIPAFVDLAVDNLDWQVFAASAATTLFIGAALFFANRGVSEELNLRQAFLMTAGSWLVISIFGALPFIYADMEMSVTHAFFESVSGITTTGATVLTGLDTMPPGILLWRAILQWMGGVGIIVTAIAVLPMLQIGGMQIFRMESSDRSEKILPRAQQIAGGIILLYVTISIACTLSYWAAGMNFFDAVAHTMTTVASGGFSTHDTSLGYFDSASIDSVAIIFMIAGSLPFTLYIQAVRGRPLALWRDDQVRWFFAILFLGVTAVTLALSTSGLFDGLDSARHAAFNVTAVLTGTGYATQDYAQWHGLPIVVLFAYAFIGGCAGSASCGVKVFRVKVLFESLWTQLRRLIEPHGIFTPHYNGRPIAESVTNAVTAFFLAFFICYVVIVLLLTMYDLDFVTAASGAAATISNLGPGLGDVIGPSGTYQTLPDGAVWILSAAMLLGRLEILGILILFSRTFWRG